MNVEEKQEEMRRKIRRSAMHVPTPESLEPGRMMDKLKALEQSRETGANENGLGAEDGILKGDADIDKIQNLSSVDGKAGENGGRFRCPKHTSKYALVAAAAIVAVLGWNQIRNGFPIHTGEVSSAWETKGDEEAADDSDKANKFAAKSYDDIYERIDEIKMEWEELYSPKRHWWDIFNPQARDVPGEKVYETAAAPAETTAAAITEAAGADSGPNMEQEAGVSAGAAVPEDYSDTNVQVEGVDEGDIVKTDGEYIYVADSYLQQIKIVRADGAEMEKVGIVQCAGEVNGYGISEFYLNGDRLSLIRSTYEDGQPILYEGEGRELLPLEEELDAAATTVEPYSYCGYPLKERMILETYDISDRANPRLEGKVIQDGQYLNSRRVGDYVYLVTTYDYGRFDDTGDGKNEAYIPKIGDEKIPYQDIYLPEETDGTSFVVISATDMREPQGEAGIKAVMADGEHFYMSQENIYIGTTSYGRSAGGGSKVELMKLSYREEKVEYTAHGWVDGYLNNQFSMDEYEGNLRLVTTVNRGNGMTANTLSVLDKDLNIIGKIEDIAPGEQIYSARFMGDMGYFVTFRNMDPLFSADLSDPRNPKLVGALKIPGFSEYLHFYSDGLMFGIGQEIDPLRGSFEGVKLSMFDISDPTNVTERDKTVIPEYSHCEAWENHKSVLISPSRNLIGFAAEGYDERYDRWESYQYYLVYSYNEGTGFQLKLKYDISDRYIRGIRGIYIGDFIYVVDSGKITAFTMDGFTESGTLNY